MTGAIEEVILDEDVQYRVIGNVRPVGLCGSALIDLTAELLRHGIVTPEGLLLDPDHLLPDVPDKLRHRVVFGEEGPEFVVATTEESGTERPITVTHRDIRQIQLATAAIRATVRVVLHQVDLKPQDLDMFYVAGAFGNYLRPGNAQRMGLLPHDMDRARIAFVGNTSLAGAVRMVLSTKTRTLADTVARNTKHIELSQDPRFLDEYTQGMYFPICERDRQGARA